MLVGAHAVMFYSEPRFTKDIDVWIPPKLNQAQRVLDALSEYGAPLKGITLETFQDEKLIFQIGVAPVRIDIMMGLPGIKPEQAWKKSKRSKYGRTTIRVIGLEELIKAKKKAARLQDKLDLENLRKKKKIKLTERKAG
jgi:hypothetical protein